MRIKLYLDKSIPENAAMYYEKAKKLKRKIEGLKKAMKQTEEKLKKIKQEKPEERKKKKERRQREWYEKFHWFFSSDGFLVIAGRDVRTNNAIVRRYMKEHDVYLHADIQGAPSTIIITEGKDVPEQTLKEAAQFAGVFSKAFSLGLGAVDVYAVKATQVKTSAKPGEYLPKGSFVIEGKRQWFRDTSLEIAVSYDKEKKRAFSAPPSAMKQKHVLIVPGKTPKGELAKKVKQRLEEMFGETIDINEILQVLPSGRGDIQ
ncbi:MAG: DUF814 domain-containing protein [Candidatus Diapherotrites archaeon]|nr:DUF814 domain-containing protein [Candidatus Diapherotrites archaeon]